MGELGEEPVQSISMGAVAVEVVSLLLVVVVTCHCPDLDIFSKG